MSASAKATHVSASASAANLSPSSLSSLNKTQLAGLIHKAFAEAKADCTSPGIFDFGEPLPGVDITFHDLITILAAVACILSSLICLVITCGHLFHWTNPNEQKQIVRIVAFIPVFSIIAFFSIWFYSAADYIAPIAQYYEGFAIVALFLLYVTYITPAESSRMQFYYDLELRGIRGKPKQSEEGSLGWFKGEWVRVFQIIPSRIATFVALEVVHSVTCPLSKQREVGSITLTVIQSVSTLIAVIAVVRFQRRMKAELKHHRALFKLFAFKVGVGLELIQSVIFTVLSEERVFFPTMYVSYNDFSVGLDQFLVCWEMLFFSILFIWAYDYAPYRRQVQEGASTKTVRAALLEVINPWDIVRGVIFMFTAFTSHPHMKGNGIGGEEHRRPMINGVKDFSDARQRYGSDDMELAGEPYSHSSSATQ